MLLLPREIYCMIIARLPVEHQARCRRVCRQFSDWFSIQKWGFVFKTYSSGAEEFPYLEYTLKRFKGLDPTKWNWAALANNDTVPEEFWIKYHDIVQQDRTHHIGFSPNAVRVFETVGMAYISRYIATCDWPNLYKHHLSYNPKLSLQFIESAIQQYGIDVWSWKKLSLCLTNIMQAVETHPEWPWKLVWVFTNDNLTTEFLREHFHEFEEHCEHHRGFHPAVTVDLVATHLDSSVWKWKRLSQSDIFTMDFIEQHLDWPWVASGLIKNPHITHAFMTRHPEFSWDWQWISENYPLSRGWLEWYGYTFARQYHGISEEEIHLTEDLVEEFFVTLKYGDEQSWVDISEHPHMTPDIVERHMDWPWNWDRLVGNPSIPWSFLYKHEDKLENGIRDPWYFYYGSSQ